MGPCDENCDFTTNQIIATTITKPKTLAAALIVSPARASARLPVLTVLRP